MSQRDLTAELRLSRVVAPADLRARVRAIAANAQVATTPRRRVTWRRALVVALPVAAAVAAAIVVTRPAHNTAAPVPQPTVAIGTAHTAPPELRAQSKAGAATIAPAPPAGRVVTYDASLGLRLRDGQAVSNAVKRALAITSSLGGYAASVDATTYAKSAAAELTLKVPRTHVQEAVERLSALGTITSEQVGLQDRQGTVDATARTIARLQRELRMLRAETQTAAVARQIAAVTTHVATLQRQRAALIRAARYATVRLALATKPVPAPVRHSPGPLHGLGIAFHWLWIGAIYAAALGLPIVALLALAFLLVRTVRRRREDALLSSR